jgi:prolyl 4-hydroxylase
MNLPNKGHYLGSVPVHDEPLICVFDHFVSDIEISRLMRAGRKGLVPAQTITDDGSINAHGRTGSVCWVTHDHDLTIAALAARISALISLPLSRAEPFQLVHYAQSQGYAPHYDGWFHDTEAARRCMERGGQRLVTCLLYLNDVPSGGGTAFPKLKMAVDARKGRMLLFHNCQRGTTALHPDSLHGGLPVPQGEKWVCNLWFRERDF